MVSDPARRWRAWRHAEEKRRGEQRRGIRGGERRRGEDRKAGRGHGELQTEPHYPRLGGSSSSTNHWTSADGWANGAQWLPAGGEGGLDSPLASRPPAVAAALGPHNQKVGRCAEEFRHAGAAESQWERADDWNVASAESAMTFPDLTRHQASLPDHAWASLFGTSLRRGSAVSLREILFTTFGNVRLVTAAPARPATQQCSLRLPDPIPPVLMCPRSERTRCRTHDRSRSGTCLGRRCVAARRCPSLVAEGPCISV